MVGCSGFDQKNKDCLKTDTFECAFSFQVLMSINQGDSVMEKEDGLGDSLQYMKPTSLFCINELKRKSIIII